MAVKKAPMKKVVAKKSPTKSSIKKKPQSLQIPGGDSEYVRKSGNKALADLMDKQKIEAEGRVYAQKPSRGKMTKSTGKLSGRAMRGGKRMNAGKLDGM